MRVAILAVAEGEFSVAREDSAGVWPLDPIDNYHQIREAKEQADFVLVIFHGGVEFYSLPSPDMVKTCRFFVDAGADSVICHHIHVPSGMEIYQGAPIIYSTGNFLFDWPSKIPPQGYLGYLVSLEIQAHSVIRVRLIPYRQRKDTSDIMRMSEPEKEDFLAEIAELSAIILDKDRLRQEFINFSQSKRIRYLSVVLSLSEFEIRLLKRGIWPFWRTDIIRFARLKNQFTCRAHYNMMVSIMDAELQNKHLR
jgi:poly-gamma-glutamate synthesis protein (capsule biosynthesis protein)